MAVIIFRMADEARKDQGQGPLECPIYLASLKAGATESRAYFSPKQ
jgi:hypothetical protein